MDEQFEMIHTNRRSSDCCDKEAIPTVTSLLRLLDNGVDDSAKSISIFLARCGLYRITQWRNYSCDSSHKTSTLNMDPEVTKMNPEVVDSFQRDGFTIVRGLFTQTECDHFSDYFTSMIERGGDGWAESTVDTTHPDPLKRYPRLLQPHRGDEVAISYMTDPRLRAALTALAGDEPYAVQTMVYFKPPGSRGQNLHQDNMYLLVHPGTCIAAWLALDDCDEENGCMVFAPNTASLPMICQVEIPGLDANQWGNMETPRPPGAPDPVHAIMKRGDVVFFNGSVIHGSYKNRSERRFRRSLIGHYIAAEATQVAKYYFPVFRMDGSRLGEGVTESAPGGPCGVYEEGGVALQGTFKSWDHVH